MSKCTSISHVLQLWARIKFLICRLQFMTVYNFKRYGILDKKDHYPNKKHVIQTEIGKFQNSRLEHDNHADRWYLY